MLQVTNMVRCVQRSVKQVRCSKKWPDSRFPPNGAKELKEYESRGHDWCETTVWRWGMSDIKLKSERVTRWLAAVYNNSRGGVGVTEWEKEGNVLLISARSRWSPPGVLDREHTAATPGYGHFCPATGANDHPVSLFFSSLLYTFSPGIAGSWFVLTHGLTGSIFLLQPP